MASDLPVYYISGHGEEYCEDGKVVDAIVPPETTYVSSAVSGCNRFSYRDRQIQDFYNTLFYAYKNVDQRALKTGIDVYSSTSIHIHSEGESYHLSNFIPLFGEGDRTVKDAIYYLRPVGVFRQPPVPSRIPIKMIRNYVAEHFTISKDDFLELHKESVYPTPAQYREEFKNYPNDNLTFDTLQTISNTFTKRVDKIMKELGPGIYYYLSCRSTTNCKKDTLRARAASASAHDTWYDTVHITISMNTDKDAAEFIKTHKPEIIDSMSIEKLRELNKFARKELKTRSSATLVNAISQAEFEMMKNSKKGGIRRTRKHKKSKRFHTRRR